MNSYLSAIFAAAKFRLTTQRVEVFNTLKQAESPLSVVQIIERCTSLDKVSVYRTIRLFSELHIITTITHGWKQSYELAAPFKPHHHHMRCSNCNKVIEVQSNKIESLINEVSNEHDFKPLSHHFEIVGLCVVCREL